MTEDYLDGLLYMEMPWCREVRERLTPDVYSQPASSRQGQLLVAASALNGAVIDGGVNWDDFPELWAAKEEFVLRHLCDGTFGERVCEFVQAAIAALNRWMNRESNDYKAAYGSIARVYTLAYHWCRLHPDAIPPLVVPWEEADSNAAPDPAA